MRTLAALLLAALLLTGCSEDATDDALSGAEDAGQSAEDLGEGLSDRLSDLEGQLQDLDLPEVDWGEYEAEAQERIDQFANQADCDSLREELDQAEGNEDVTDYVQTLIDEVC